MMTPAATQAGTASVRGRVPNRSLFFYALPQVPHGFALLPVVNYVPGFYSDQLGMQLAVVGIVLVLTRITDVITDPIIGAWSDRTRSRFGRRKPFIIGGLPILLAAAWFVFVPGQQASPIYLFFGLFFMYLGFTIVDIPYQAWGAELSNDYDERTRISAWRGVAEFAGSLLTLGVPVILQMLGHTDLALTMMAMAILFILLQPLCFALAVWKVPEPKEERIAQPALGWRQRWSVLFRNGPLMQLCGAMFLLVTGMAVGATLNMIIFKHVVGQPEFFAPAIFVQNVVAILCIPLWLRLSAVVGKHRGAALAMVLIGVCSALTFLAGRGDGWTLGAITVGIGAAMGGAIAQVRAMVADLVDRDLVETGEERTGLFVAAVSLSTKFAAVFGVLIGTAIPGMAGFQPSEAVHAADSLLVLRTVYAFTCPLLVAPAFLLLWRYPLTRKIQEGYRAKIDAMRA